MSPYCGACGGSGDAWDKEHDDWAKPRRNCEQCNGDGRDGAGE